MKFLASLLVAFTITLYVYLVSLLMHICAWWLSPFILIFALALAIYFITKDNPKW